MLILRGIIRIVHVRIQPYEMSREIYDGTASHIQLDATSEPRLWIMNVVLSDEPAMAERDEIGAAMTEFSDNYEGRLILSIGFEGPAVQVSTQTIMDLVARLTCMKPENVKKLKGCLVKPRQMTSQESTLATLFKTWYAMTATLLVTSNATSQERFVARLVERERMKRIRRESSLK